MNSILGFEMSAIATALGWTILHSAWQVILVTLGLKIVLTAVSNRLSNLRYLLSCLGLVIIVGWAGVTFLEAYQDMQTIDNQIVTEPSAQSLTVEVMEDAVPILIDNTVLSWNFQVEDYIPIITFCWFFGVFLFGSWLIHGFIKINQLQKIGIYPTPAEWQMRLVRLCEQMKITKKVRLLISDRVEGPITFNVLKPVILLPVQLLTGLSPQQIEVLLLHELAHIRRYDYLVNLFQSIFEVLFFFHPAIWWLNRQIRQEREYCCDDLVLQIQQQPHLYANVLTTVQVTHFSSKTKLVMSANQERGQFTTRIHRLFGKYEYTSVSLKGVFIALLLVSGLLYQEISAQKTPETAHDQSEEVVIEKPERAPVLRANVEVEETPTKVEETPKMEEMPEIPKEEINESIVIESLEQDTVPLTNTKEETATSDDSQDEESIAKVSKHGNSAMPENPESGACYHQGVVHDKYEKITKEYLIYTGDPNKAPASAKKMTFETKPATQKWEKKVAKKNCMSKDPKDCLVWCLVDVPAKKEDLIVLENDGETKDFIRKEMTSYVLSKKGGLDWIQILCPDQVTIDVIEQVQRKLKAKGYYKGAITKEKNMSLAVQEALVNFQNDHKLPGAGLNMQTVTALSIKYKPKK